MKQTKIAILCLHNFNAMKSKTGNMLLRYRPEDVVCIISANQAGMSAQSVLGFGGEIPVVATIHDASAYTPNTVVIGDTAPGGKLSDDALNIIKAAISYHYHIINGMHQFLTAIPELQSLADQHKVNLLDLRRPPQIHHFPTAAWKNRKTPVLLTVGTDCNTGKMTTAWELTQQLQQKGYRIKFVGTGQTGILLGNTGVAVDAVVADFLAGEIEHAIQLVDDEKTDLIIVEGQGALTNQYYSGVSLGLLHGSMPDFLVMTHDLSRTHDVSNQPIGTLSDAILLHQQLMKPFKPIKFVGINCISAQLTELTTQNTLEALRNTHHLPVSDIVRFHDQAIANAITQQLGQPCSH